MAYIAPKDFSLDPELMEMLARTLSGELKLDWMDSIRERIAATPTEAKRGLTLDDINQGSYGPDQIPEIVRHNFSMAPRGAILPPSLPSLGYRLNRKSELWADTATRIYEEGKTRHWRPARDVPWEALDQADWSEDESAALRQTATNLVSIGLVSTDLPARWEFLMNQEFHEIKYLMCLQMIDGARIAEAFRKRALYGRGQLGEDSPELGDLLKMVIESGTFPCASASMNLLLFSFVQGLGRHWEWASRNAADTFLGTHLAQDASRFIGYGVDHIRSLVQTRASEAESLNGHLDLMENGLVGAIGSRQVIEPLIVLSGGLGPVAGLYERVFEGYMARCRAAGLGDRRERSPIQTFLAMIKG
ncbi:MAG: hypothetical protein CL908_08925 [Deltaproteobacteria bacterium]|jgi:hypothetical protein|nr:hypothetical protein [Deltaproteobacteria bacterium]